MISNRRSFLGIVLLVLGVLFLAGNFGWLRIWPAVIWPLVFVWFGLTTGWRLLGWFSWVRLTLSLMLVSLGLLMSLQAAGIPVSLPNGFELRARDVFGRGWPLLLVALGLDWLTRRSIVQMGWRWRCPGHGSRWPRRSSRFGRWGRWGGPSRSDRGAEARLGGRPESEPPADGQAGVDAGRTHVEEGNWLGRHGDWEDVGQMFGDVRLGRGWKLRNASISMMFGDLQLDLSQAQVDPGEYRLEISLIAGDVDVYVPADVEVAVEAEAYAGRLRVFSQERGGVSPAISYESPGYGTAEKKVRIRAYLGAGDFAVARAG